MMNLAFNPYHRVQDHWTFNCQFYRKNSSAHGHIIQGTHYLIFKDTVINNVHYKYGAMVTSKDYNLTVGPKGSCVSIEVGNLHHDETVIYSREELTKGALSYIDGGTNTTAIHPRRKGEPVINYAHFPPGMNQTLHTHPSQRIGFCLKGNGAVELGNGSSYNVKEGEAFLMSRLELHNFVTTDEDVVLLVWAPDSDAGATDTDNALLNRTYVGQR